MVAHSSVVLPEPGLDTRFSARTPWLRKCARFCCATRLFAPSTSCSIRIARDSLRPGTATCAAPAPKCRSPVCASTTSPVPPGSFTFWAGLLHPHTTHMVRSFLGHLQIHHAQGIAPLGREPPGTTGRTRLATRHDFHCLAAVQAPG